MNNENINEKEIDLSELFFVLLNKLWMIIAVAVVAGLLAFSYTELFVTPMYTTTASIYVDRNNDDSSATSGLTITTNIAKDSPFIIKSDRVLAPVVENLGLNMSPRALSSYVSVTFPETENNTRVMLITVRYKHPQVAANIANNIVKVASEVLPQYSEFTQVKIVPIDPAAVPSAPSSPNTFRNVIIAAFVGAVLNALIIVLVYLFNDKISSVDEIEKYLNLSVLGVIPNMNSKNGKKYSYGKYLRKYSSESQHNTDN